MTSEGSIAGGLLLIFLAGVFNGSWNASFSPKFNLAVGKSGQSNENPKKQEEDDVLNANDITYHHAFALFQTYAAIINIPICIFWAGGIQRVNEILLNTAPSSIVLVVVFSFIWGVGTVLFGLACKIAGVGLGTNLSMGIIAVIGTFLPLITENTLISPAGGVICIGLAICCVGLWIATRALAMRDDDERKEGGQSDNNNDISMKGLDVNDEDVNGDDEVEDGISYEESMDAAGEEGEPIFVEPGTGEGKGQAVVAEIDVPIEVDQGGKHYPTWKKVGICAATGICAAQLQFAFIFGEQITDLALGNDDADASIHGSTHESGGAAIIWLLAISLGAPVAILNGILSSPVSLSSVLRTPLSRHLKIIFSTSLPWISHIHIYGVCATILLPAKVAASIGWPMLMMITTGQALLLSVFLGEWKAASDKTLRALKCSILTTVVGIGVLMSSVAVP